MKQNKYYIISNDNGRTRFVSENGTPSSLTVSFWRLEDNPNDATFYETELAAICTEKLLNILYPTRTFTHVRVKRVGKPAFYTVNLGNAMFNRMQDYPKKNIHAPALSETIRFAKRYPDRDTASIKCWALDMDFPLLDFRVRPHWFVHKEGHGCM